MEPFLTLYFDLDRLPLSDNEVYVYFKRGEGKARRVLTAPGRKWKKVVTERVTAVTHNNAFPMARNAEGRNLALLGCTMRITIHQVMPRESIWRRDAHNGAKLLVDSMCEVIALDDRYAVEVVISKSLGSTELTQVFVEFYKDGKV